MWTCRICTLKNEDSAHECDACGEERSHAELEESTSPMKRKAGGAPVRGEPEEDSETWACSECTLVNDIASERCEACSAAPKKKNRVQTPQSPQYDTWTCPRCTLENNDELQECTACGNKKPGMDSDQDDDFIQIDSQSQSEAVAGPSAKLSAAAGRGSSPADSEEQNDDAASDSEMWECPLCTLLNATTSKTCEACGLELGGEEEEEEEEEEDKPQEEDKNDAEAEAAAKDNETQDDETAAAAAESHRTTAGDRPKTDKERLLSGEVLERPGSHSEPYKVKYLHGVFSCTCPGWKFQRVGIDLRTCRHLREILGEASEMKRTNSGSKRSNSGAKGGAAGAAGGAGGGRAGGGGAGAGGGGSMDIVGGVNKTVAGKITLAHSYDGKVDPTGWLMSEKLDGMRAFWDGRGTLWTRTGHKIHSPDWFVKDLPQDLMLDGELFLGRGKFQELMSISRQHVPNEAQWKRLEYVVFDAPGVHGGLMARLDKARKDGFGGKDRCGYARLHPQTVCRGKGHVEAEMARVQGEGGEGLMLRKPEALHRAGRTSDLLKVKSQSEDEALVLGHQAGKGKNSGVMGALECVNRKGKRFKVGTGFSDAQRRDPPKIGSVITFKYQELTVAGIPRHPAFFRIRPDVSPAEFPK